MQQDLWRLRFQKRWTINELAERSGVPGLSIHEYEQGRRVRDADLSKLAEALDVEPEAIKAESDPKPARRRGQRQPGRPARKPPEPKLATLSQINHLMALATRLGMSEEDLTAEVGRPMESMQKREMSNLLTEFAARVRKRKAEISEDPSGAKRWRAHLPEGVDSFELEYLKEQTRRKRLIAFTLLNGEKFQGRIVGFSPYNITIRTEDDQETTLQKLAIAYYTLAGEGKGAA